MSLSALSIPTEPEGIFSFLVHETLLWAQFLLRWIAGVEILDEQFARNFPTKRMESWNSILTDD